MHMRKQTPSPGTRPPPLALFGHLISHPFPSSSQYSSSPRSLSCQLSSVFLLLSTWLFHTQLSLKATCVQKKNVKQNLPRPTKNHWKSCTSAAHPSLPTTHFTIYASMCCANLSTCAMSTGTRRACEDAPTSARSESKYLMRRLCELRLRQKALTKPQQDGRCKEQTRSTQPQVWKASAKENRTTAT